MEIYLNDRKVKSLINLLNIVKSKKMTDPSETYSFNSYNPIPNPNMHTNYYGASDAQRNESQQPMGLMKSGENLHVTVVPMETSLNPYQKDLLIRGNSIRFDNPK